MTAAMQYVVRYSVVIYEDDDETTYRTVRRSQEFRNLRAAADFAKRLDNLRDHDFEGIRRHEYVRLTPEEQREFTSGRSDE